MTDSVVYALPNGLPNRLAVWIDRYYVRPQLEQIFLYREHRFAQLIDSATPLPFEVPADA